MKANACEALVRRMIGNQMGMSLDVWSSRSVARSDDRSLAGDTYMLQLLREVLALPEFKLAQLSGNVDGQLDDEGQPYSNCYSSVRVELEIEGQTFSVDKDEGLYEIEELAEQLEGQGHAGAARVREVVEVLSKMVKMVEDGHFSEVDFWKENDTFSITRELYDQHRLKTSEVNWIGLAKRLLQRNYVEPGLADPPVRWTPYELARVRERLKLGMHPECTDEAGQSPLNAAAYWDCGHAVRALLEAGADPNGIDATAVSPVVTAAYRGRAAILDALLEAGGRIDGPAHAPTALFAFHADSQANHPLPLSELLLRGLDLHARMPDGGTLAEDVECYTKDENQIRAVRAAVMSDGIFRAMSERDGDAAPAAKSSALTL